MSEAARSDLAWLADQVATLFVHDANGRILHWNGPAGDRDAAPRFFFGRTAHGTLWRFRDDVPHAVVRELARLAGLERFDVEPGAQPERQASFVEWLETDAAIERIHHGPAFRFPDPLAACEAEVHFLRAGSGEPALAGFPALRASLAGREPCAAVLEGGLAVSACYAATLPGPGGCVEAGVDTLEGHRGRGHAARATRAWAGEVRRRGGTPLYSTAFSNRASRALARRLGLIEYAVDLHFR